MMASGTVQNMPQFEVAKMDSRSRFIITTMRRGARTAKRSVKRLDKTLREGDKNDGCGTKTAHDGEVEESRSEERLA
jgi:hypothetical protein